MSDAAPPAPPHPKAAAKGLGKFLGGRPPWQYVAMVTVVIGVAYLIHRRQVAATAATAAAQDGNTSPAYTDPGVAMDSPSSAVPGDSGSGYVTPPPTQGAYYGGDNPATTGTPAPFSPLPALVPLAPGQVYYDPSTGSAVSGGPAPVTVGVNGSVPAATAAPPTGGGPPATPTGAHTPAAAAPKPRPAAVGSVVTNQSHNQHAGRRFKVERKKVGKHVHVIHAYESVPGKGDWGKGGNQDMGPA